MNNLYIPILFFVFGILFMIYALIKNHKSNEQLQDYREDLEEAIKEAKYMIRELNQFSETVSQEIEKKHQELLFLYNRIEDKNKKNEVQYQERKKDTNIYSNPTKAQESKQKDKSITNKVIQGYKSGKNIETIAKDLHIGKGEVKLILDLQKVD